jgi:hypothetical protein
MMNKVEIDLEKFLAVIEALKSCVVAPVETSAPKALAKRGRPRKVKPEDTTPSDVDILQVEEILGKTVDEIVNEKTPVISTTTFTPKSRDHSVASVATKAIQVNTVDRKMSFIDIQNVADRISPDKYPPRHEPRPPAKKIKMICSQCHNAFEGYPGEYQQAFTTFNVPEMGLEDKPQSIKCNNCSVK